MILILDNIRSAYNVGSLFRTADAVGIEQIYLLGVSPLPFDRFGRVDKEIAKTSLGAQEHVAWKHVREEECVRELTLAGYTILPLEQQHGSVDLFEYTPQKGQKIALVVGNEVTGVSSFFLDSGYQCIEIPMNGKKESLNVSVAGGIALYVLSHALAK